MKTPPVSYETEAAANAWAKPDTALICGECYELEDEDGEPTVCRMVAQEPDEEQEAA
jgi:hypothetical protein